MNLLGILAVALVTWGCATTAPTPPPDVGRSEVPRMSVRLRGSAPEDGAYLEIARALLEAEGFPIRTGDGEATEVEATLHRVTTIVGGERVSTTLFLVGRIGDDALAPVSVQYVSADAAAERASVAALCFAFRRRLLDAVASN